MRVPNPLLRVAILGAAILVWANLTVYRQTVQTLPIQATIQNLPAGTAVAELPPTILATVSGSAKNLRAINSASLLFSIDLANASIGQTITSEVQLITQPAGVTVLDWQPRKVTIPIDVTTTAQVPVVVDTSGNLADGYKLVSLVADPATITVTGSAQLISKIGQAVANIDISHRSSTFSKPVGVSLDPGHSGGLTALPISPGSVTVTANIEAGNSTRHLGIKPQFSGQIPDGYFVREVRFDPALITLTGADRALSSITELLSTPIKLTDHRQTFTEKVSAILPKGVRVDGENLFRVTIEIELAEASREFSIAPQFTNVSDGFTVKSVTPKTIQVVVVGQPAVLDQLTRNQIQLKVDLSGILSGGSKLPITAGMFELPSGVGVGSFTPGEIEVILARS